jgi:dimethylglycine dehydrogenase
METNVDVAVIGGYAHSSDASVAMSYIPADSDDGFDGFDGFEVEILGQMRPARLLPEPLYDPAGRRMCV